MPLDLASLIGVFLPLGGEPLLGRDLVPPPFIMAAGGGVCGLGGRLLGAAGTLGLPEMEEGGEVWVTGRREEDSLRGRMRG